MAITNASRLADFGSGIGTEGAVLQIDNINERIGIGTTNPNATLTVAGRINVGSGSLANIGLAAYNDSTTSSQPTLYAENDQTSGNLFLGYGGGALKVTITAAGAASFAGGSFAVESDGEISTNMHSHGHLKLDSGADFSSPNISLLADTGAASFAGIVTTSQYFEDSIGKLRSIPQNSKTSSYTAVSSDSGKHISITTGGVTIGAAVFSVGDAFSIYNNSGSTQLITQGAGVTLRYAGSSSTGNRNLLQYGICSVLCVSSNEFVISGTGLS